jgi:hypothetical protein
VLKNYTVATYAARELPQTKQGLLAAALALALAEMMYARCCLCGAVAAQGSVYQIQGPRQVPWNQDDDSESSSSGGGGANRVGRLPSRSSGLKLLTCGQMQREHADGWACCCAPG